MSGSYRIGVEREYDPGVIALCVCISTILTLEKIGQSFYTGSVIISFQCVCAFSAVDLNI